MLAGLKKEDILVIDDEENLRLNARLPILEISKALVSEVNLERLAQLTLETVQCALEADRVSLMLLDETQQELSILAALGLSEEVVATTRVKVGQGLAGLAAHKKNPILVPDQVENDPVIQPQKGTLLLAQKEIKSAICVPLVLKDRVLGVLNVSRPAGGAPFCQDDVDLLFILCGQIAVAIENARLFEQTQRELAVRKLVEEALKQRAAQLALLNDISGKIAAALELDSVLDRAVHLVQESFGYHHVAFFAMEREQGELVMGAKTGLFTTIFPPDHRIKLGQGMVGWVGRHGKRLLANDVSAEPCYVNFFPEAIHTRSELSVPIQVSGEVVGVLDVQSPQPNAFDENDVMVMETLADQIAVSIENLRLYEAVQQELAERKRVEEALRESEERYRLLVETMNEGLGVDDENGLITYVNERLCEMLGYSRHEMIGHPTADFFDEANQNILKEQEARRKKGEHSPYEIEITGKDRKVPIIISPKPIFDADGHFKGTFAVITDTTERKRAEEALRESEEKYRTLVEKAREVIVTFGPDGRVIAANPAAAAMLGYQSPEEIIGQSADASVDPSQREALFAELRAKGYAENFEATLLKQDGSGTHVHVLASATLHRDEKGEIQRAEAIFTDITERKRAEEVLRRYADEQAALYAVTSAVAASLDPDELLSTVLDVTLSVLDSHAGWVLLPGPTPDDPPHIVAWRGVSESFVVAAAAIPLRTCPACAPLLADGDAQVKPQLIECPHLLSEMLAGTDSCRYVCIPLSAGNQVLGVMNIAWRASDPLSEADSALLMAIGRDVGLALHNAQLYQAARQVDRLRVLNALDRALAATLEPETVAETTLLQTAAALDAPMGALFVLPSQANACPRQAFTLERGWMDMATSEEEAQQLQAFLRQFQDGREAISFSGDDLAAISRHLDLAQRWGSNGLIIPIRSDGGLVAMLALGGRPADRPFTDEDRALAQAAMGRAGQAIQNARLYQETVRRLEEAETLSAVTTALTKSLDLDQVLQSIVDSATHLIPASTSGMIHLADEAAGKLIPRATSVPGVNIEEKLEIPIGKGIAGLAMQEKRLINVPNVEKDPRFLPLGTATPMKSLLTAPLMIDGDCIGALSLNSDQVNAFSADDEQLLMTLAAQATIAVRNARLHQEVQHRLEELVFLNRVGHTVTSSLNLEQVLATVMQEATDVLKVEAVSVLLLDDEGKELVFETVIGSQAEKLKGLRLPLEQGIAGWVAREGQRLLVPDVREDPRFYSGIDETSDFVTRSVLAVPLKVKGKVIGVIEAVNKTEGHFSQADVALLSSMAQPAAISIENARLFEQAQWEIAERKRAEESLRRRNKELTALNAIATTIGQSLDLDHILNATLDKMLEVVEIDAGWIQLLDEEAGVLSLAAQRGFSQKMAQEIKTIKLGEGMTGKVAQSGQPIVVAQVPILSKAEGADAPRFSAETGKWCPEPVEGRCPEPVEGRESLHAFTSVPIKSKDKVLGVLGVFSRSPRQRSAVGSQEVQLLTAIGHQIGVAIENVRLAEEASEIEILQELNRLRSELIANVSHELRTPLGLIKVFCSSLLMDDIDFDRETRSKFLRHAEEEADKLEKIVDNLLDLSRMEGGRLLLDKCPTDVGQLAREVIETTKLEMDVPTLHSPLSILHDFPLDPLVVTVDPRRIEQVLRNLLSNAIKYSTEGGTITVQGRGDKRQLLVRVSDQGIGIPSKDLERVFERFYRVENETTQGVRGAGLGLAVCRGIVEAHGGRIWVESTLGVGSTFYFTLPVAAESKPGEGLEPS